MANAKAKLYYTTTEYLDSLPVKNGNIIFVPENNLFCLDMSNERFSYHTIQTFMTDEERLAVSKLINGFYYVQETHVIWRYDEEGWSQTTPSNLMPTKYGDSVEDFPTEGNKDTLYFTDDGVYNWKDKLKDYNLVANVNTWDSIN